MPQYEALLNLQNRIYDMTVGYYSRNLVHTYGTYVHIMLKLHAFFVWEMLPCVWRSGIMYVHTCTYVFGLLTTSSGNDAVKDFTDISLLAAEFLFLHVALIVCCASCSISAAITPADITDRRGGGRTRRVYQRDADIG